VSGWFSKPKEEREADLGRYKSARKAAEAGTRKLGIRDESPTSRELNNLVIEAEREIPWWRR
jgi:hypothetical protein